METVVALIGKDDDACFVSLEDRHILDNVPHDRFRVSRCTDNDQGLCGQIDVLLIFHHVGGNGSVAKLAQFNPDFIGRCLVRPAADNRPVLFLPCQFPDRVLNLFLLIQHPIHHVRGLLQVVQFLRNLITGQCPQHLGQIKGQDMAGHNL